VKAIRVSAHGGPEVLRLESIPDPVPGADHVLVRLHAIGINPVETYIRSGRYARHETLPYTPGTDGAGVVMQVGSGVTGLSEGDRVYLSGSVTGTYAELALCERAQVHPLPEGVDFKDGAALGVPYATAHRALFHRGGAKAGEWLLVHGASGGVGSAAVQLARGAGLRIIGTAGSDAGLEFVRSLGAHHALDHRQAGYAEQVKALTDGGVDLILEMLANVNLQTDLTLLRHHGRVVVVGSRATIEINPRDAMMRDADIRGMTLFNATPADLAAIHRDLQDGLRAGVVRPKIGRTFPLAEAAAAHEALMTDGKTGKILLIP
jgi:NADPH2:quinone reductase